jgi:hypothetical protein
MFSDLGKMDIMQHVHMSAMLQDEHIERVRATRAQSVVDHFLFPSHVSRLDEPENGDRPLYLASPIAITIIRRSTRCRIGCVEQQRAATLPRSMSYSVLIVVQVAHPRKPYTTTGAATSLKLTRMTATVKPACKRELRFRIVLTCHMRPTG